MPSFATLARLAVAALLAAGCGPTATAESPAADSFGAPRSSAASVGSASAGASPIAGSSVSSSAGEARLPTGPPQALEAGTYLTPEGFEPAVSITVPDGWYGGAGRSGFAAGQGMNQGEFADAGLYLDLVPVPYDDAVATFGELEGIVFNEPSSTVELDGHEATIFYGSPLGDQVLLDELVPGIDLIAAAHQQLLIDVDGQTILVRTELHTDDAEGPLIEVVDSLQFP